MGCFGRHAPASRSAAGSEARRLVHASPDASELPCPDCLAHYPSDRYSDAYRITISDGDGDGHRDPLGTYSYPRRLHLR